MSRTGPSGGAVKGDDARAQPTPDFATFFAVSLDLLVIRDSQFRIVKVNPAWEAVLGYSMAELEGRPMVEFVHPDDVAATHDQMQRVIGERDVRGFINRYRRKDGDYRYLEWRARQEGEFCYGVARDVTERIALETEMTAARAEAEAANQAKREFLANMSHEIRTPLNGVIGVAAALAQTSLSAQQGEMVELILTSGQTLERVVSDLLDFSKIEAGRLEIDAQPFDLRAEADGLFELYRLRADEKGLAFAVDYGPGAEGWFSGDAVRIKQVFGNLVSNAIKFTAEGEVRVGVDVRADAGAGTWLDLQVRDTGIGFDEDFARKLFQRFSQADGSITRRFGGTGLGLSICHALVEMMGGRLSATSTAGEGACFRATLPLQRQAPPAADAARGAPELASIERSGEPGIEPPLRILLAEDHEINRRVVELILGPVGAMLTSVVNGAEALSAYETGAFEVVLMDMQMPVMDGLAATRAIRRLEAARADGRRTPIVMLSANAMRHHREEALAAGADLHLAKPVTAASLLGAVAQALELSRADADTVAAE
ncbi:MAG TPA: ATP-binding protein [Caulobacteraceae bacterium]|nr:ATP-binding protein [Caulobacteraceae bacterium]